MNIIVKNPLPTMNFRVFKFLFFKFLFSVIIFIFYYVTVRERQLGLSQNVMISTDPDYISNYIIYRYIMY